MSNDAGPASWSPQFVLDRLFINGAFLTEQANFPISVREATGVYIQSASNGVKQTQRPYRGDAAPEEYDAKEFSIALGSAAYLADYLAWKTAKANQPVTFCYGGREVDIFNYTGVESGFTLSRPRATDGDVPGVDETSHPTVVKLDGVVDASAADVSGQVVTPHTTGLITVEYTPLYTVVITSLPENLRGHNDLVVNVDLEEIIQGDFG